MIFNQKDVSSVSSAESNNVMIRKATLYALLVSGFLCVLKFANCFVSGSLAIQASALDSLMDIGVSLANYFVMRLTQRVKNSYFPYGYDKIAALIAFLQVLLIGSLSGWVIKECFDKFANSSSDVPNSLAGSLIIIFSLFTTLFLVRYQSKVIKKTGSLIVKADMLHYKTDLFTNFGILIGCMFIWLLGFNWLDPLIGCFASVFVLFSTVSLGWDSISSLLDMNNLKLVDKVHLALFEKGYKFEKKDIAVSFSGTKTKIHLNLHLDLVLTKQYDLVELKKEIQSSFPEYTIIITFDI